MIIEASLIVTYVTMGVTPIIYNILAARRALKKRAKDENGYGEVKALNQEAEEEVSSFTLTVPCSVTFLNTSDGEGNAIHLSVKSVCPLPAQHVKRVLHQG